MCARAPLWLACAQATNQGNSQVSSFGFGGTNAHGIFWGQNISIKEDGGWSQCSCRPSNWLKLVSDVIASESDRIPGSTDLRLNSRPSFVCSFQLPSFLLLPHVGEDVERVWMKKLLSRPPPEVRPMGWHPRGPESPKRGVGGVV